MIKRKILIISTVGLIYDGITSVITSYLDAMDLSDLDIRLVGTIKVDETIRGKIENIGCKIVEFPNRKKEIVKYFNTLRKYIHKEKIEIVHIHGNSATLAIDLLAAKLGGASKRIVHSHNTKCNQVRADRLLRPLFYHLYTDALACGYDAGKWLYKDRPFTVIKNGRDVDKYAFNQDVRNKLRKEFDIKNHEIVIGHVGGFVEQKNHLYLIKVFKEVLSITSNVKLILIGDGPLKETIERKAADIKDNIVFLGNTDHVEDYLNMMDVMILPSLFEGLPLVVVEWQINGLPCIISSNITSDCIFSNKVFKLSIEEDPSVWAAIIIKMTDKERRVENSENGKQSAIEAGYDINASAKELHALYEIIR